MTYMAGKGHYSVMVGGGGVADKGLRQNTDVVTFQFDIHKIV